MNKIDFAKIRKTIDVDIEGTTVTLRALSVGQMHVLKKSEGEFRGLEQLELAIIDKETGDTVYTVEDLKEMDGAVCTILIDKLNELHGVKDQAETVKN